MKQKKITIIFAAIIILLGMKASSASAATYYVAPATNGGKNSNLGTQTEPFETLNYAVTKLMAGDTLLVRGGTYAESLINNIPSGIDWSKPVTIMAFSGETVTMKPNVGAASVIHITGSGTSTPHHIIIDGLIIDAINTTSRAIRMGLTDNEGAHHIRIKNCEIKNTGQGTIPRILPDSWCGITLEPLTNNIEIINCKVHHNGKSENEHSIYVSSDYNLIEGCEIYNNAAWGIHNYSSRPEKYEPDNNIYRNNVIHNNGFAGNKAGILLGNGKNNLAYNNIVYDNYGGIEINWGGPSYDYKVFNNTVYNNRDFGIHVSNNANNAVLKNNIAFLNTTNPNNNIVNEGIKTTLSNNLTTTDPKFVNATAFDFRLQSTSPAMNAGVALPEVTTDILGVSRPQGGAYDIGAYEYTSGTPSTPKYKCSSGACIQDDINGTFTSSNCDNTCTPQAPPTLSAHFRLNEATGQTLTDSSTNNNQAFLGTNSTAEPSDPQRTVGKQGNALQFDATDDLATISPNSSINNLESFSYSAWIYPTGWGGQNYGRIISKETAGNPDLAILVNQALGNTWDAGIYNTDNNLFCSAAAANSITFNKWQYLAVTYNNATDRKIHLYMNGVGVQYLRQDTVTGTLKTNSNPLFIGNSGAGTASFQGKIDEITIHQGALTQTEVLALYQSANQTTYQNSDLNEDSQTNVSDLGILMSDFGKTTNLLNPRSDINGDGTVNVTDLGIMMSEWGS